MRPPSCSAEKQLAMLGTLICQGSRQRSLAEHVKFCLHVPWENHHQVKVPVDLTSINQLAASQEVPWLGQHLAGNTPHTKVTC